MLSVRDSFFTSHSLSRILSGTCHTGKGTRACCLQLAGTRELTVIALFFFFGLRNNQKEQGNKRSELSSTDCNFWMPGLNQDTCFAPVLAPLQQFGST